MSAWVSEKVKNIRWKILFKDNPFCSWKLVLFFIYLLLLLLFSHIVLDDDDDIVVSY